MFIHFLVESMLEIIMKEPVPQFGPRGTPNPLAGQATHFEIPTQWTVVSCRITHAILCVFSEEEKNDYKFSVLTVQSWLVHRFMFLYFQHINKLLNYLSFKCVKNFL
jgi:hypothetical protein